MQHNLDAAAAGLASEPTEPQSRSPSSVAQATTGTAGPPLSSSAGGRGKRGSLACSPPFKFNGQSVNHIRR